MASMADGFEKAVMHIIRRKGYDVKEAQGLTREQILSEMDADTVQLLAAMPNGYMERIWKALGVNE